MDTEATAGYSSIHLRESDKLLFDIHQKEVAILEKKLEKVKSRYDETAKHLFDAVDRGRKLAQSLGFNDVYDAQFTIDSVDHDISFRECYDRLHKQDDQLSAGQKEIATLERKLHNSEERVKELQTQLEARTSDRSTESNIREQLRRLTEQYDALKDVKERAAERYKADFKKWRAFNDWLFTEDADHRKYRNESGITPDEKKRRDMASIMRKKQKLIEIGPDLARFEGEPEDGDVALTNPGRPPSLGRVEMSSDKENEGTPMQQYKKRRISTTPTSQTLTSSTAKGENRTTTPPVLARNGLLKSVTNIAAPSSSPTGFLGPSMPGESPTRVPLTFQPISSALHVKGAPSSTTSPVHVNKSSSPLRPSPALAKRPRMPNSSDTEDDSQALYVPISGTPGVFKVPAPPPSSNPFKMVSTQHKAPGGSSPSAGDEVSLPEVTIHPSLPCRPAFASSSTKEDNRRKARLSLAVPMRSREPNQEASRPTKVRRLSGVEFGPSGKCIPRNETDSIADTPSRMHPSQTEALGGEDVACAKKDNGKSREIQSELVTPVLTRTSGQKRLDDYSAFKGRGRYGNGGESNQPGDTTINAQYSIDPNQNEGLNFQYDLVVRNRDERRRLNAGDCECCREYYEGVGPLPSRLQPPLWCSPPTTPARPCLRLSHSHPPEDQSPSGSRTSKERNPLTSSTSKHRDVELHKKAISRHRHAWARATTPPGYWDIGFPDTQAVGDINEKAKQMHKRKKAEIGEEAGNGVGRYRRR